jgi:hypothetical protein
MYLQDGQESARLYRKQHLENSKALTPGCHADLCRRFRDHPAGGTNKSRSKVCPILLRIEYVPLDFGQALLHAIMSQTIFCFAYLLRQPVGARCRSLEPLAAGGQRGLHPSAANRIRRRQLESENYFLVLQLHVLCTCKGRSGIHIRVLARASACKATSEASIVPFFTVKVSLFCLGPPSAGARVLKIASVLHIK